MALKWPSISIQKSWSFTFNFFEKLKIVDMGAVHGSSWGSSWGRRAVRRSSSYVLMGTWEQFSSLLWKIIWWQIEEKSEYLKVPTQWNYQMSLTVLCRFINYFCNILEPLLCSKAPINWYKHWFCPWERSFIDLNDISPTFIFQLAYLDCVIHKIQIQLNIKLLLPVACL